MAAPPRTLLDEALPRWDVVERHFRVVRAGRAATWQALLSTPVRDLPLTRLLMRVRALGSDTLGDPQGPVLAAFPPGEVARREGRELLLALVAPTGWRTPVRSARELRPGSVEDLQRPLADGWVRIGMAFRLVDVGTGDGDGDADGEGAGRATELHTETRVAATGPGAERAFRAYWTLIGGWSALTRRELLRAVARRAEGGGA
jgi:hypothetical protein